VAGDNSLGGIDYDNAVYEYSLGMIRSEIGDKNRYVLNDVDIGRIRSEAERAKIALSSRNETSMIIQNLEVSEHGLRSLEITIDRDLFRQLTADLNSRVEACVWQVLKRARIGADELSLVLLAGQGLKIFTVNELVRNLFPSVSVETAFQETAVGQGLARYTGVFSGHLKNLLLLDANYTAIGIACIAADGLERTLGVSSDPAQNCSTFELLPSGATVPSFHGPFWLDVESGGDGSVPIRIIEKSTLEGVRDSTVAAIKIEANESEEPIEIAVDADANRTIVLWVKVPSKRVIVGYQLNNFHARTLDRPLTRYRKVGAFAYDFGVGMDTEGFDIRFVAKPQFDVALS
jgi:molecular chaperone DnaK (HSP70)